MAEEIVNPFFCMDEGGSTVPAGSRVVLRFGWGTKTKGQLTNFLKAQTTTISLDGAAAIDLSDSWSAIEPRPDEGDFVARVRHDTGVTLSAGESLQADGMMAVSHVSFDGFFDEDTHRPFLFRPGEPQTFSCRITASA